MKINDTKELVKKIGDLLHQKPQTKIITVDGWTDSGKTKIVSPLLQKTLEWKLVEADSKILVKKRGEFIWDPKDVEDTFKRKSHIILDSILALEILNSAGVSSDIKVYVKSVKKNGEWIYQHIVDEKSSEQKLLNYYENPLEQQLIKYHRTYKPHTTADIVFLSYKKFNDYCLKNPELFYE